MNNKEKKLLGRCIRKYRLQHYTQEEFCKGICSKFTLSRLENGTLSKDILYNKLINRLGFYYNDCFDITNIELLFKQIIYYISIDDTSNIIKTLASLESVTSFYPTHILFVEYQQYIRFLKIHYCENKEIIFLKEDISTLLYLENEVYIVSMHVLCENMLFHNDFDKLKTFLPEYYKDINNVLIDYFLTFYNQINGFQTEAYSIFRKYKYTLLEDHQHVQYIRYKCIIALGCIDEEQNKALKIVNKIQILSSKLNYHSPYLIFIYYISALSNIKLNNYSVAFSNLLTGLKEVPSSKKFLIPYLIPLALLLEKELPNEYLIKTNHSLCDLYLTYYHLHQTVTHRRELILFINKSFPKKFKNLEASHPMPTLIRSVIVKLVDESFCYRSAIQFDILLKQHCK